MSDSDRNSPAWRVSPGAYLDSRPAAFDLPDAPVSTYVTMRDGCRIAVDAWLPRPREGGPARERVPAVLVLTPYYRRFRVRDGATADPIPNAGKFVRLLVPHGYAVVVVDVRGTGASFGTRDSFRSPRERDDSREIADWVVAQDWSDGRIGATGISYPGAASDFLASTGHPAVRAVAPLFAVWDTWTDHYYPGGILLNRLSHSYDELMIAMDHDRRDLLSKISYYADPAYAGPHPVDEDADGALLAEAVAEHHGNFHMPDFITEFRFREDPLPYDAGFSSASFSPAAYSAHIRPDVAVFACSGWLDGAGFSNAAIARYLTLRDNPVHLLLGPWDHGARTNISPWRKEADAQFSLTGALLRFFDHYLMGRATGLEQEARVHSFSLHAERWREDAAWPPPTKPATLHLTAGGGLAAAPAAAGEVSFKADFVAGSGDGTRYERLAAVNTRNYYTDWAQRVARMPGFSSAPLAADTEITGHAIVDLWLRSSEPDAAIFAYLSEIEADGTVHYVTEGLLRALHRKESPAPASHRTSWPFRSFHRADAAPLVAGEPTRMRIPLLPTSWVFKAGSRIHLCFAGADADHCTQVPHGRPPLLGILHGGAHASTLELPVRAAD